MAPATSALRGAPSREHVAEIQRARLLGAAVAVVDELGYERATVAHVTRRAGVSRRTFYDLFSNREQCIAAVIEDAAAQVRAELAADGVPGLPWRERMRAGLWTILCFLDCEPVLARVLLVQTPRASGPALEARELVLGELIAAVDGGRTESPGARAQSELAAEGAVGAILAILQARLARGNRSPLRGLLGELSAMLVLPFLGAAAARREQTRPEPAAPDAHSERVPRGAADPLAALPMRVTYRTARVLEGAGRRPGASNRQLAQYAGIADQGQISKLLARLQHLGLLANAGAGYGKGEPNAWSLTATGTQVAQAIASHSFTASGGRRA